MEKNAKIYVAGHRGLVGSALIRKLNEQGYVNIITRTHAELDLTSQAETHTFFENEQPEYVFLAAAKVGGIVANNTYPADFIYNNLMIQTNVIQSAYDFGVKRLLFLGSSCIYPRDCPQPIKEEYFLTGSLESTNRPYAVAKIAGIEMCWSYNRQFGTQYLAVMPTNLYGPGDNYHLENSHVIPALVRKFYKAKKNNASSVSVWGTGKPYREFMYSDDMADACIFLMKLSSDTYNAIASNKIIPPLINVGCGVDVTIQELAETVKKITGYDGGIEFDKTKPDGTPRKLLDVERLSELGWVAKIKLKDGLVLTYKDFIEQQKDFCDV